MTLDDIILKLSDPGLRIPWLWEWLKNDVWSVQRYTNLKTDDYLREGERQVCALEDVIASAADRTYLELVQKNLSGRSILEMLKDHQTAVIVFDGLSIREMPLIETLSNKSGFRILESGYAVASVPSETLEFIHQNLSLENVGPSQLPTRRELKEKGIKVVYAESSSASPNLDYKEPLLVWSAFPDNKYLDSDARFAEHFGNIHTLFESAWINLVQGVRGKRRIVITSDHGYIYFGTGLDVQRSNKDQKILNDYFGNDRNKVISNGPVPNQNDIYLDAARNVAVIKGRVKTRSTGAAAQKLYKHGGLSLMEMLVPWVVLEIS